MVAPHWPTFAQATPWRDMGAHFREGGSPLDPTGLLIVLAVLFAVCALLWLLMRLHGRRERRPYHAPRRLFLQLCDAHRISWREGWLLWRLARAQRLAQPGMLFVQGDLLTPSHVPGKFQRRQKVLDRLRSRLFPSQKRVEKETDSTPPTAEQPTAT